MAHCPFKKNTPSPFFQHTETANQILARIRQQKYNSQDSKGPHQETANQILARSEQELLETTLPEVRGSTNTDVPESQPEDFPRQVSLEEDSDQQVLETQLTEQELEIFFRFTLPDDADCESEL